MTTSVDFNKQIVVRDLGRQPYQEIWQAMQTFTDQRNIESGDELWLLEHEPVFTQGQAGKQEHLLNTGDIPVVNVDRGGQVTYHGPGQLVVYVLLDIKRRKLGVRNLVTMLEQCIVDVMAKYGIVASAKPDAPGVYVNQSKLCSLGLRIRKGRSFHGLAFNIDMDLSPFLRINPCGYAGMNMVNSKSLKGPATVDDAKQQVVETLCALLQISNIKYRDTLNE